jgi:phospholipid/cholesterol/gamma-HCH transport system substrate-binding protein
MTPRNRNLAVGAVVLGALLALGWMILQFSGSPVSSLFDKGMPIVIQTPRADGLSEGSPVLYLGMQVGRVTKIRRVADKPLVEIAATLNEGEVVPSNVTGFIRPMSNLSSAAGLYLELTRDTAGERVQSKESLTAGATITATLGGGGIVPPEIIDLAVSIQRLTAEADQIRLVSNVNKTVLEMQKQLQSAGELIQSANAVIGDPKLKEDIASTMASVRVTADNLRQVSAKLDTLTVETTDTLKVARGTLSDGGKRVDELSRQMGERLTQVGELLDRFNAIAAKVDKGEGTLGSLLNDPRLYASLVDTSREMNLTVKDLRRLVEQWEQEGFTLKLK